MVIKKAIEFYYKLGGSLVPAAYKSKVPTLKNWSKNIVSKEDFIKAYSKKKMNYAFIIPKNMFIVDIEAHKGGLKTVDILKKQGIDIKKTYTVTTGRGGLHCYYSYDGELALNKKSFMKFEGIEILTTGHLITIPPSVHQNGKPYTASKNTKIKPIDSGLLKHFFKAKDVAIEDKTLEYYLSFLSIKDFRDFSEWIKILFSVYDFCGGSAEGFEIFKKWSLGDDMYKGKDDNIKYQIPSSKPQTG